MQNQQVSKLDQVDGINVVYSYIGNFIVTRELVFLTSLIALVLSWKLLLHVLYFGARRNRRVRGGLVDESVEFFVDGVLKGLGDAAEKFGLISMDDELEEQDWGDDTYLQENEDYFD